MLLALLFAIGLTISPVTQERPYCSSREMKQLLDLRGIAVASVRAIRGTAFLIDRTGEADRHLPRGDLYSRRPLSSEEVILTPEQVSHFVGLLRGERTYMPDLIKLCVPNYELGVTLVSTKGYTEFLFCLSCDEMLVLDGKDWYGINTDQGHNALLDFFRQVFPKNEALKVINRRDQEQVLTAKTAIEWAEDCIPNDPLLKKVKAMRPEQQTFEVLEELANKATYSFRNWGKGTSKEKRKGSRR